MTKYTEEYVEGNDTTYDFFERFMTPYINSEKKDLKELGLNVTDKEFFDNLNETYKQSKTIPATEWNGEEELADALAFFMTCGLIFKKNGNYMINCSKLNYFSSMYQKAKENNEIGEVLVKKAPTQK